MQKLTNIYNCLGRGEFRSATTSSEGSTLRASVYFSHRNMVKKSNLEPKD